MSGRTLSKKTQFNFTFPLENLFEEISGSSILEMDNQ
jgi:hypothetical protein